MLACVFSGLQTFAQGVNFEELTLQEAIAKAKAENKLVFLDGYTTWCGPCKHMTENIFPQKEAGDFFNEHFVNVKFDMEKGEGIDIKNNFKVKAFPTFLILNADGEEQYRIVGGGDVKGFIERVTRGMNPKNSVSVLEKEYQTGKMKKNRMTTYVTSLYDAYDTEKAKEVTEKLMKEVKAKDKMSAAFWPTYTNSQANPITVEATAFVLENHKKFNKNVGEEKVNQYLESSYNKMLEQLISGRKAEVNPSTLETIIAQLNSVNLPNKENLMVKSEVASAVIANDTDRIFSLLEANASGFSAGDMWTYASIFHKSDRKDKALMGRVAKLGEVFTEHAEEANKNYFKQMFSPYRKAASTGVYWDDLSLEDALKMAKAGRTLVFVDCYTTWCGPCKHMTEVVFPQEEVGDFFNQNFINIKIDMEKGDGPEIAKRYGIRAYPTFLILRPDGSVQHKILGGGDAQGIIKRAQDGLNEATSTGYLDNQYEKGNKDKAFLASYAQSLLGLYESEKAKTVSNELLSQLSDTEKMSPDYWFIYESNDLSGLNSDNFNFLVKNRKAFIKANGEEKVNNVFFQIYANKILPILYGRDAKTTVADLNKLKKEIGGYKLGNQAELYSMVEVSKAFIEKDINKLINTSKKEIKNVSPNVAMNLFMPVLGHIKKNMNENQKSQFTSLVDMVIEKAPNEASKNYIKSVAQ